MGLNFINSRSHCDYCKKILHWYDLIPILSFVILKGRCRYCAKRLSYQYPLIELLTGVVFSSIFYFYYPIQIQLNDIFMLPYLLIILSGLIVVFFTDLKYRIIPDEILVILMITIIGYRITSYNNLFQPSDFLLTGLLSSLIFLFLFIITRGRGMGFGDVKYAFLMGLMLGGNKTIVSLYLSFLTGACISLILIGKGRKKMKSTIPFGPFLVFGTVISLFYGTNLWHVFLKILGV